MTPLPLFTRTFEAIPLALVVMSATFGAPPYASALPATPLAAATATATPAPSTSLAVTTAAAPPVRRCQYVDVWLESEKCEIDCGGVSQGTVDANINPDFSTFATATLCVDVNAVGTAAGKEAACVAVAGAIPSPHFPMDIITTSCLGAFCATKPPKTQASCQSFCVATPDDISCNFGDFEDPCPCSTQGFSAPYIITDPGESLENYYKNLVNQLW